MHQQSDYKLIKWSIINNLSNLQLLTASITYTNHYSRGYQCESLERELTSFDTVTRSTGRARISPGHANQGLGLDRPIQDSQLPFQMLSSAGCTEVPTSRLNCTCPQQMQKCPGSDSHDSMSFVPWGTAHACPLIVVPKTPRLGTAMHTVSRSPEKTCGCGCQGSQVFHEHSPLL